MRQVIAESDNVRPHIMNARTLKTFPWYEMALIVALCLIGWVTFRLYEITPEGGETRKQYQELQIGFLQIADFVVTNINELNNSLALYLQTRNSAELQKFQHKSLEWQRWYEQAQRQPGQALNKPAAAESLDLPRAYTSTGEPQRGKDGFMTLMSQIQREFSNYTNAAHYLIENAGAPLIRGRVAARKRELEDARSNLLSFAEKARVYSDLAQGFLSSPPQRFGELEEHFRHLRFALLLALISLSFMFMWGIYRGQLARSRHIIQQHKQQHLQQQTNLDKLAHFGRLAQELAHEIKQPLTAMGARIYTLQKLLPPDSDTLKDAAVIRTEIKRLDKIVKDFLDLARPTLPRLVPVAAEKTLKEIQDLMSPQLAEHAIELKCECSGDVRVLADVYQLKQVLINLVRNAADSLTDGEVAAEGGTITLRAEKTSRELRGAVTDVAVIEVADTGPGIPAEIQKRIFDPFFSTKTDGTGLGLAIASEIVDKHCGSLEFDSEPGKGTVFRILLPAGRNGKPNEQSSPN